VLEVHFEKGGLVLSLGPALLGVAILAGLVTLVWCWRNRGGILANYSVVEATLKIADIGEVKIQPNRETMRIAYQAWVELNTRKVALPFDEENDVIAEVYNSYDEVFGRLRDLAKSIPAHQLRRSRDTKKLVEIMADVLNKGLRPHLTRWQARFRSWYVEEMKETENLGMAPQDVQKRFKGYPELVKDLKGLQLEVVKYAEFLREIAQGKG
jgi:hypothetical protein